MTEEQQVKVEKVAEEEDVASAPSASNSAEDGSPETSPATRAARKTKKDLMAFLEKGGSSNHNSLTDVTEHTVETMETVETEIWNTANKIIEDKLEQERAEDRRRLDRVIQRFKDKRDKLKADLKKVQQEKSRLATERDDMQKALEEEKKNGEKTLSVHRRALERNDRMQTSADRLRQRIETLEKERYSWVDERSKLMCTLFDLQAQVQRQKKTTKKPYPSNSDKGLESIPEGQSSEQQAIESPTGILKQDQKKNIEAILAYQLKEVTKQFDFQRKLLSMKNEELTKMEERNQALSNALEFMSKKQKSYDSVVADLRKDVQMAKDSRRPLMERNKVLRHEVRRLQETIGSFSEQIVLQQAFVKSVKDHVCEGKITQEKEANALLKVCRDFEMELQATTAAAKPPRHSSKRSLGAHRSSDKKSSTEKLADLSQDQQKQTFPELQAHGHYERNIN